MILPLLNARIVLFAVLCFYLLPSSANWYTIDGRGGKLTAPAVEPIAKTKSFDLVSINAVELELLLAYAVTGHPWEAVNSTALLTVPMPDNETATFRIVETSVMAVGLAQRFPSIKTYYGICTDNPALRIRFDQTPAGFHAMITGDIGGTIIIDPWNVGETEIHMMYRRSSQVRYQNFECHISETDAGTASAMRLAGDCQLRQYRLAVSATGEFTTFHGGTVSDGLAAVVTIVNRINEVYERDFGVTLQLVANNALLIYTNAATDPFTSLSAMLGENISTCSSVIGNSNFDVGHVFTASGGGVAYGGVICNNSFKAGGVTGVFPPVGDVFAIDYAAHELGHQFACGHTQNNNCNRSLSSSYEPGSASTILGYAGICAPDVQSNSDAMMHGISIQQATGHILGSGGSCATIISSSNNNAPAVSGGADFTIPKSTPFRLTATASDLDGDALTYSWEIWDATPATMPPVGTSTDGPNFRTNLPASSPTRYFPNLSDLGLGIAPTWEVLSDVARSMPFRVTVRDNHPGHGCTDEDDVNLTVSGSAGPVVVTSPTGGTIWYGGTVAVVNWDVAGTNTAPVNCNTVNILLSTDLGNTYPTVLASGIPNNGIASVTVPPLTSSSAKIMVEGADNPLFQVSPGFFTIDPGGFTGILVDAGPASISVCGENSVSYNVNVATAGSTAPVTLTATGLPSGSTGSFSVNPVIPPASSTLTITGLDGAAAGTFSILVDGDNGTDTDNATVSLENVDGGIVSIDLLTDNYGSETTLEITDDLGVIVATETGFVNNTNYTFSYCLAAGCYTFTIYDSYGDGICCGFGIGSYSVTADGIVVGSGGEFTDQESAPFCLGTTTGSSCVSLDPPVNLVSTVNPITSEVTLSWDIVSGATAYRVTGGPLGGGTGNSPPIIGETNTSWSPPSSVLNAGVTYEWQVRAACGALPGASPITALSVSDQFTMPTLKQAAGVIRIYPNPADRNVQVSSNTNSAAQLVVYNASGQIVLKERIVSSGLIDVSQWEQGLYQFRFYNEGRYEVQTVSVIH